MVQTDAPVLKFNYVTFTDWLSFPLAATAAAYRKQTLQYHLGGGQSVFLSLAVFLSAWNQPNNGYEWAGGWYLWEKPTTQNWIQLMTERMEVASKASISLSHVKSKPNGLTLCLLPVTLTISWNILTPCPTTEHVTDLNLPTTFFWLKMRVGGTEAIFLCAVLSVFSGTCCSHGSCDCWCLCTLNRHSLGAATYFREAISMRALCDF